MQDTNSTPPVEGKTPDSTPVTPETPVAAPQIATPVTSAAPTASTTLQDPNAKNFLVALLLSIFLGNLGIDRFYLGHIGLGIAKLLLNWLTFGIWWLVDVILIATKKVKNVTWES